MLNCETGEGKVNSMEKSEEEEEVEQLNKLRSSTLESPTILKHTTSSFHVS